MKELIEANSVKTYYTELDCGHYQTDDDGNCTIDLDDGCDCDTYSNSNQKHIEKVSRIW